MSSGALPRWDMKNANRCAPAGIGIDVGGQLYIEHALAPVAAVLLEETWRAGVVALGSVD